MKLKLSEAIRLGSMASDKCRLVLEEDDGRRCALGAALFAAGEPRVPQRLFVRWPWLGSDILPEFICCPECHALYRITAAIACLNDNHLWTRERIADWVATIEPPEVEAVQQPQQPQVEVDRAPTTSV